jgi:hypothetical protein
MDQNQSPSSTQMQQNINVETLIKLLQGTSQQQNSSETATNIYFEHFDINVESISSYIQWLENYMNLKGLNKPELEVKQVQSFLSIPL